MFDKEFYPTPDMVARKMLSNYDTDKLKKIGAILEPSAGKGDLCDAIIGKFYDANIIKNNIYCIEKNEDLQTILKSKRYKIIDSDFLSYIKDIDFGLIIMNPPFSNGSKHFLKAWEIARNTDIVCLLNEETIKNPYTKERKLIKKIIEDNNGTVEYLGNCFNASERKTNVRVAMVKVSKKTEDPKIEFSGFENEKIEHITIDDNEIMSSDKIEAIISRYHASNKYFTKGVAFIQKSQDLVKDMFDDHFNAFDIASGYEDKNQKTINFIQELKSVIWNNIIDKLNIEKYMTSRLRNDFRNFTMEYKDMAISKKNIFRLAEIIMQNSSSILENSIIEIFDWWTEHYHENRLHVEGWKTNSAWKVNKKIILPNIVSFGEYTSACNLKQYGDNFRISFSQTEKLSDIDKALCYISGEKIERIISIGKALERKFDNIGRIRTGDKYDNTCNSTFFYIKFWKKGTIHIEFRDNWLWKEFNIRACIGKNWLPNAEKEEYYAEKEKKKIKKISLF